MRRRKFLLPVVMIFLTSIYGCSLLEETYSVSIVNDTLHEATVYFDGGKPRVLNEAYFFDNNWDLPIVDRYNIGEVKEGDHTLEVKCEDDVYKQTLYVDKDIKLMVSELSYDFPPSVYH